MSKNILLIAFVTFSSLCFAATPKFSPNTLSVYGPVKVQKPLLLDSVDVKGKKYSDDNLLSTAVNFPEQSKFTGVLFVDTAGYFRPAKPTAGQVFYFVSFYVNNDRYAKAKIKVKSPDRFELYINDKKEADKKTTEDSLKNAKTAEADLSGNIKGTRILLKYLVSEKSKAEPAFQITIEPDKKDSTAVYTFDNKGLRPVTIEDILIGKRVSGVSVSPGGKFVLINYNTTDNEGKVSYQVEVIETKQNKVIFSENSNRTQLGWMPKSDILRYFTDTDNGRSLYTLNPLTGTVTLIASNLPKQNFIFSPDEKNLYYSKDEKMEPKSPKGLNRLSSPEDRQDYYRSRYFIYRYELESGLSQQLTFGMNTANISDISRDGRYLLIRSSMETVTEQPFSKNTMIMLDLETMKTDTLWKNEKFAGGADFSPDGKQILISGGPDAFNGIGLNIKPG